MTQFVGHKTTEIKAKADYQSLCVSGSSHFACLNQKFLKFRLENRSPTMCINQQYALHSCD